NSLRLFQESLSAFFGAAGIHAFSPPSLDLRFLVRSQVQRCQVGAGRLVGVRYALGATCLVPCFSFRERTRCSKHRRRRNRS
ncbi:MAG: hypothetical protein JWO45_2090, partial [Spartobacteria bacterium]|nr:hypothetical protein [Spartobacteria bacterium]